VCGQTINLGLFANEDFKIEEEGDTYNMLVNNKDQQALLLDTNCVRKEVKGGKKRCVSVLSLARQRAVACANSSLTHSLREQAVRFEASRSLEPVLDARGANHGQLQSQGAYHARWFDLDAV
jgi:hypothetical protein